MTLGDVRDFVRKYARQFVLIARGLEQSGMHADKAAGQGEGVDVRVVDDKKREALAAIRLPTTLMYSVTSGSSTTAPLRRICAMIARPSRASSDLDSTASAGLPMSGSLMSSAPAPLVATSNAAVRVKAIRFSVRPIKSRACFKVS
jgi:hypothetical protein